MSRANIILTVVLVVQLALVGTLFLGGEEENESGLARGGALLSDFDVETVTEITVEDDQGFTFTVSRQDGVWVLPDAGDFPASPAQVDTRLNNLDNLDAERIVTRSASNHRRFQVAEDNFFRRLTLVDASGTETVLYYGAQGTGTNRYTRVDGEDEVYLNSDPGAAQLSTDPTTWIDTTYFSFPPTDIESIVIENENGIVMLVQDDANVWTVPDLASNEAMVASQVSQITSRFGTYRLDDPVGTEILPEYGLDAPTVTITLNVRVPDPNPPVIDADAALDVGGDEEDATAPAEPEVPTIIETHTLVYGAPTGEAGYYTKYDDNEYVVTTPDTFVNTLIDATRDTLVQNASYSIFGG